MYQALIYKELREVGWLGIVALVYGLYGVWNLTSPQQGSSGMGLEVFSTSPNYVGPPFLFEGTPSQVGWVGFLLGTVVGLWQSLGEELRGTWLFLLHRPLPRSRTLAIKLLVGLGTVLVALGIPFTVYALWAVTRGREIAPFYWWMTVPTLYAAAGGVVAYLGAFLSGMRPARWYGTRFWPMVAAGLVIIVIQIEVIPHSIRSLLILIAIAVGLTASFYQLRTRDFG